MAVEEIAQTVLAEAEVQEEEVVDTITFQGMRMYWVEMAEEDISEGAVVAQDRGIIPPIWVGHMEGLEGHMAARAVQADILRTKRTILQAQEPMGGVPLVPIHSSIIREAVPEGQSQVQALITLVVEAVEDIPLKVAPEGRVIMDPQMNSEEAVEAVEPWVERVEMPVPHPIATATVVLGMVPAEEVTANIIPIMTMEEAGVVDMEQVPIQMSMVRVMMVA